MIPHYSDAHTTIWLGDAREALAAMEPDSVDCVITSPPYFGLRDYGLPPAAWGGDPDHEHAWGPQVAQDSRHRYTADNSGPKQVYVAGDAQPRERGAFCECGAWCGQL